MIDFKIIKKLSNIFANKAIEFEEYSISHSNLINISYGRVRLDESAAITWELSTSAIHVTIFEINDKGNRYSKGRVTISNNKKYYSSQELDPSFFKYKKFFEEFTHPLRAFVCAS